MKRITPFGFCTTIVVVALFYLFLSPVKAAPTGTILGNIRDANDAALKTSDQMDWTSDKFFGEHETEIYPPEVYPRCGASYHCSRRRA